MSANVRQLRPWQEGSSSLKDPPTPLVDKLTAVALAPMGAGNPPGNPASRSPAGARPAATLLSNWVRWLVFLKLCGAAEILSKTFSLVFYIAQNCFLVYRKRFAEAAGKFHAKHLRWFTSITGLHNGSIVATLFAISGNHKPAECTTGNCDRASRDLVRRIRWCSRRRCKHSRSRETRRQSFG